MYFEKLNTRTVATDDKTIFDQTSDTVESFGLTDEEYAVIRDNYTDTGFDVSIAKITTATASPNFFVPNRDLAQMVSVGKSSSVTVADIWQQIDDLEMYSGLERKRLNDIELHDVDGSVTVLLGL